jgi:hypothetical protein
MSTISATIKELAAKIARTEKELVSLKAAAAALGRLDDSDAKPVAGKRGPKRGGMSAAGRARIAAAQKARWAKSKAVKVAPPAAAKPAKKKRKMSAAGRARIGAAAKARWAKIKAEKQSQATK